MAAMRKLVRDDQGLVEVEGALRAGLPSRVGRSSESVERKELTRPHRLCVLSS